ncbi:hypothetical protein B0H66DRAFT_92751 [Apodospora peruviana]|uniref:Zn(2)-C6 fungal-type domain-containing protein n=1 Tax=Apodospora peruviana TaxID=516989 RepID=A0AAE0IVA7_9PEZI|nr:hypothetical protein B0H66DRAFT_92751 [Apodospora peruviana]
MAPKRSRDGCITCKIRRVKCDETRPECKRCVLQGRACDGYTSNAATPMSRRALATAVRQLHVVGPASRVLGRPLPVDDVACFDFFRHCTASMTGSVFPGEFWSRHMLQVSHTEPAAWRAAVALGALHRRWETTGGRKAPKLTHNTNTIRFTQQAMQHYYSAMTLARSVRNPATLAVISAALAAAAHLAGRWGDIQVHIRAGLNLLRELEIKTETDQPSSLSSSPSLDSVAQTLERLDIQSMAFSDARVPYAYDAAFNCNSKHPDLDRCNRPSPAYLSVRQNVFEFRDLDHAALVLFRLTRQMFILSGTASAAIISLVEFESTRRQMTEDAKIWEAALEALLKRQETIRQNDTAGKPLQDPEKQQQQRTLVLSLRLYHATLYLILGATKAEYALSERGWDHQIPLFERIVSLAAEVAAHTVSPLPFFMSLEPGLAMPLYLTVIRCRHPVIRRRALALLRTLNRQEGVWNCAMAARAAEQVVMIEEEGIEMGLPLRASYEDLRDVVYSPPDLGNRSSHGDDGSEKDDEQPIYWPGGWPNIPEEKRFREQDVTFDVEDNKLRLAIHTTDSGRSRPRVVTLD